MAAVVSLLTELQFKVTTVKSFTVLAAGLIKTDAVFFNNCPTYHCGATILSITTSSIMTLSITTLSIIINKTLLIIMPDHC